MSEFQRAYARLRAARARYDAASRLHERVVHRYRLFGRDPDEPGVGALWDKLDTRRAAVEDALSDAQWRLDQLWDDASRELSPVGDFAEQFAVTRDAMRQGGEELLHPALAHVVRSWSYLGWQQW
jgi:hypothetical protein